MKTSQAFKELFDGMIKPLVLYWFFRTISSQKLIKELNGTLPKEATYLVNQYPLYRKHIFLGNGSLDIIYVFIGYDYETDLNIPIIIKQDSYRSSVTTFEHIFVYECNNGIWKDCKKKN